MSTTVFRSLFKHGVFEEFDHVRYIGLLQDLAPEVWNQYYTPVRSCVYVWCDGDEVLYVGQSKNWNGRLAAHLIWMLGSETDAMYRHFSRAHEAGTLTVVVEPCPVEDLDRVEEETIRAFSHEGMYNVVHNPVMGRARVSMVGMDLMGTLERGRADQQDVLRELGERNLADPRLEQYRAKNLLIGWDDSTPWVTPTVKCEHCDHTGKWGHMYGHFDACPDAPWHKIKQEHELTAVMYPEVVQRFYKAIRENGISTGDRRTFARIGCSTNRPFFEHLLLKIGQKTVVGKAAHYHIA